MVENKPGATGNIGTSLVARAGPDGHTLLMTSNPFTANVSLLKSIPDDPLKSFVPIIEVGVAALALAVHPSVPAKSIKELVAYLRTKNGSDIKHIPYKGSAGALQDLMAGHVSLGFVPPHTSSALAPNGKLRLLAVASRERVKVEPNVPTFVEEGLPNFEVELWYGLLAPAGTPPAIVARYSTAIFVTIGEVRRVNRPPKHCRTISMATALESYLEKIPRGISARSGSVRRRWRAPR